MALTKRSFFAALEQLDHSDDSEDDEHEFSINSGTNKTQTARHSSTANVAAVPAATKSPAPLPLARAYSDPQSAACSESSRGLDSLKGREPEEINQRRVIAHSRLSGPSSVQRSNTTGSMPETKTTGLASKRRKVSNIKVVPGEKQIFKNLVFFFFPNNDVSSLRRLRIQRAQEHGAQWAREWSSAITHVVMDKGLSYQDLIIYLKLEYVAENITIVNDSYPPECLKYSAVINSSQTRFRVPGTPLPAPSVSPVEHAVDKPRPHDSLPLKKSRREQEQLDLNISQVSANSDLDTAHVVGAMSEAPCEPVDDGAKETAENAHDRDALDDIIDETKALSHLPLDTVEFTDEAMIDDPGYDSADSSNSEQARKIPGTHREKRSAGSWAQSFACMQEYDPDAQRANPNTRTIEVLQQMLDYYTRNADQWHILGYRKAIAALRRQSQKITTRTQALAIQGIGQRIAEKIEEIVLTDHLRQLENTGQTDEDRVIQQFLGIYGVGLRQASDWVAQGYRSLSDLRDRAPLTKNQQIGVDRYHDFALRIPRKEVEAHGAIVRQAVQTADKDMQVIIAGSYRRGALNSGDIDCLITKPNATLEQIRSMMVDVVVPGLFRDGFLQVGLATSKRHDHDGSKWHGASSLPNSKVWRRIDLLYVPGNQIGAALLYFTGNDIFNRSMRLLARKKGLCLNQRGLFANVIRDSKQLKTNPGRLLEGKDEKRIFALLGVPWRPPEHRIC